MPSTKHASRTAVAFVATLMSVVYSAYGQHRLDLTDQIDQMKQKAGAGVGVGMGSRGISGQGKTPLPLEVSTVLLSSLQLASGRALVYEITLKNIGKSSVELPWATKPVGRTRLDPEEQELYLTLEGKDVKGARSILAATILAGVPFSRSLLTLQPGETATIRASLEPRIDRDSLLLRADQTTDVRFAVYISRAGRPTEEIRSEPIAVTVSSSPSKQR